MNQQQFLHHQETSILFGHLSSILSAKINLSTTGIKDEDTDSIIRQHFIFNPSAKTLAMFNMVITILT